MAVASKILKNFNLYFDGNDFVGQVDEFTPPNLSIKEEDYRAGGMDAPISIDMGMEKMDTDFTLNGYSSDVLTRFGIAEGQTVPLVGRGALEDINGNITAVVITMTGTIKSIESGAWKPGEKSTLKVSMNLRYYKYVMASETLHEIDVLNYIRKINGVDQLAETRTAMGI